MDVDLLFSLWIPLEYTRDPREREEILGITTEHFLLQVVSGVNGLRLKILYLSC